MKIQLVAAGFCLVATISPAEPPATPVAAHSFIPESGFVPDEKTAIRIAVAVWYPIYGEKQIEKEQPYTAKLKDGVWEVRGSLPGLTLGGTAIAEISKKDGTILRVSHGQ
jgi:hypothetical protein